MDKLFAKFANATAHVAGTPAVFLSCVVLVLVWAVSGPFFGFSENWQLVINTGTTHHLPDGLSDPEHAES